MPQATPDSPQAPTPPTDEQIHAAVQAELQRIRSDENREAAIAKSVQTLTAGKAEAEHQVALLARERDGLKQTVATLTEERDAALADAGEKAKTLQDKDGELVAANKRLAEAQTQLTQISRQKTVADRLNRIETAELPDKVKETLKQRAQAAGDDGALTHSDDALNQMISDLTDAYTAGKGAGKPEGQGGQPAGGKPQTPAAETQATAGDGADDELDDDAPPSDPATEGGHDIALATASLLAGGAKVTSEGVKTWADNFGCGD